ncbi:hypothetical protein [Dawidia cretensis]|nr:hypothetical protein [Dawidia cretensis]
MKPSLLLFALVAMILSSCGFAHTCPTYAKKPVVKTAPVKGTRI